MTDLADRKYRVYYNNNRYTSSCKVYNGDHRYALKNYLSLKVPVETGGGISLPNGDMLFINERYGLLDPGVTGSSERGGIGLSLASGNAFIAYLLIPKNVGQYSSRQETGYGVFYDLNGSEYLNGNIIKIYDLGVNDLYDDLAPKDMYQYESNCLKYGLSCTGIIVLKGDNWELISNSRYAGKTISLASGEEVYVSGPSAEDGIGIYFTLSSGRTSTSYYIRDGEILAHSSSNWFSSMLPKNGDEIHIYVYNEGEDEYEFGQHNMWDNETYISGIIPELCELKVVNGNWTILEDNS